MAFVLREKPALVAPWRPGWKGLDSDGEVLVLCALPRRVLKWGSWWLVCQCTQSSPLHVPKGLMYLADFGILLRALVSKWICAQPSDDVQPRSETERTVFLPGNHTVRLFTPRTLYLVLISQQASVRGKLGSPKSIPRLDVHDLGHEAKLDECVSRRQGYLWLCHDKWIVDL